MKNILLLVCLIPTVVLTYGQESLLDILPVENGSVIYTGIVKVDSISKNVLYSSAKKWFVDYYKSAKDVIQLDDKENGEITGKGIFKVSFFTLEPYIRHTISILVKDGRYKYIITDFSYSDNQDHKFPIEKFPKGWAGQRKLYTTVNGEVNEIIASIEKFMKMKRSDDW